MSFSFFPYPVPLFGKEPPPCCLGFIFISCPRLWWDSHAIWNLIPHHHASPFISCSSLEIKQKTLHPDPSNFFNIYKNLEQEKLTTYTRKFVGILRDLPMAGVWHISRRKKRIHWQNGKLIWINLLSGKWGCFHYFELIWEWAFGWFLLDAGSKKASSPCPL